MCFTYPQTSGQDFEWFQTFDHIGSYCNGPCIDPAATLTISSTAGLGLVAGALKRRRITLGAHGGTR